MVVLRTFDNYFSANILLTRLQQHGVKAFLLDENTVTLSPFFGNAIGNIKVVVGQDDAGLALTLADTFEARARQDEMCASCGGREFEMVTRQSRNTFGSFFTRLMNQLAPAEKTYRCINCGHET
jgi:hypothetical protein